VAANRTDRRLSDGSIADPTPGVHRLPSLTGLRFAAAFGVFGFHFAPYLAGSAHALLGDAFDEANSGVSFFFILSGLVLTWSRRPRDTRGRFYQRRFARIYPDYLVAWVLTLVGLAYQGRVFDLKAGGLSLLLVQSWVPRLNIFLGWNGVSWTLSCEAFFYLLFPFIVARVERLRRPLVLVPFLCLPTLALGIVGLIRYPHAHPVTLIWLQSILPPVRLCEFVVGIVLAIELRRGTLPHVPLWAAGMALAAVYVLLSRALLYWLVVPLFIPFLALVIVAAAQRDLAGRRTLWNWRPLVLLGESSYAFYLLHQLIIRVWAGADHHRTLKITSAPVGLLWFVVLLAVSIAAALALFRLVEVPCERRLRGSSPPRLELAPELTG
jgi:peptidoglycan/LPS O-acetylase OafA/YrhL